MAGLSLLDELKALKDSHQQKRNVQKNIFCYSATEINTGLWYN